MSKKIIIQHEQLNRPQGLLFLVCPLSQGQTKRKNQLCDLCASSAAGGEIF
jgi:hypothetical protein